MACTGYLVLSTLFFSTLPHCPVALFLFTFYISLLLYLTREECEVRAGEEVRG